MRRSCRVHRQPRSPHRDRAVARERGRRGARARRPACSTSCADGPPDGDATGRSCSATTSRPGTDPRLPTHRRPRRRLPPAAGDPARRRSRGAREPRGARRRGGRSTPGRGTRRRREPTGRLTRQANDVVGLWVMALGRRPRAAGLCSSRPRRSRPPRGITAVHEMSMPHWNGERDLRVLLDHRARLPVDALPIVATTDLGHRDRQRSRRDRRRPAGRRLDRREDGLGGGALRRRGAAVRATSPMTSSPSSSTAGTPRDCRSACTRSATGRSSRCSRCGSGSTTRSILANDAISVPGDTASSTSRWSRRPRWNEPRCSGWPPRCNRRSTRHGASPAGSTSNGSEPSAPTP